MADKGVKKWLRFTKLGKPLFDTFICFKVPFKDTLNRALDPDDKFYVYDLFKKIPRLGLVIDLTKTTRYYDSRSITDQKIEYAKIFMAGQGSLPPKKQVNQFFEIIDNFLNRLQITNSKRNLIGVHCTHGVNRTGYMVCKYLIEKMNVQPETAIREFESTRGHQIERHGYREDILRSKQGDRPVVQPSLQVLRSEFEQSQSYGSGNNHFYPKGRSKDQQEVRESSNQRKNQNKSTNGLRKPRIFYADVVKKTVNPIDTKTCISSEVAKMLINSPVANDGAEEGKVNDSNTDIVNGLQHVDRQSKGSASPVIPHTRNRRPSNSWRSSHDRAARVDQHHRRRFSPSPSNAPWYKQRRQNRNSNHNHRTTNEMRSMNETTERRDRHGNIIRRPSDRRTYYNS